MQRSIEKTCQVIWDALEEYGRIEWKWTLLDLEKVPDVAYQNVLNKFNFVFLFFYFEGGGVKSLSVTRINLVVTWKVRPQMIIISWFPLKLHWFSRDGYVLILSCPSHSLLSTYLILNSNAIKHQLTSSQPPFTPNNKIYVLMILEDPTTLQKNGYMILYLQQTIIIHATCLIP